MFYFPHIVLVVAFGEFLKWNGETILDIDAEAAELQQVYDKVGIYEETLDALKLRIEGKVKCARDVTWKRLREFGVCYVFGFVCLASIMLKYDVNRDFFFMHHVQRIHFLNERPC